VPRIRSVKPEFWKDEKMPKRLPGTRGRDARLLSIALWNFCEDHGVMRGHPAYVKGEVFPYDDDLTAQDVEELLFLLEANGSIVRFEREGQTYLWVRNFKKHQRIDKPSKTSLPEPSEEEKAKPPPQVPAAQAFREGSGSSRGVVEEYSRKDMEGEVEEEVEVEGDSLSSSNSTDGITGFGSFRSELINKGAQEDLRQADSIGAPLRATPQQRPLLEVQEALKPDPVEIVFEYWRGKLNHRKAALDNKRRGYIEKRLDDGYSVADLCQAIDGLAVTPHNRGQNENGQPYDGIHIVFGDADQVDRFMGNAKSPPPPKRTNPKFMSAQDTNKDAFAKTGTIDGF
jgi:transposase-like protein